MAASKNSSIKNRKKSEKEELNKSCCCEIKGEHNEDEEKQESAIYNLQISNQNHFYNLDQEVRKEEEKLLSSSPQKHYLLQSKGNQNASSKLIFQQSRDQSLQQIRQQLQINRIKIKNTFNQQKNKTLNMSMQLEKTDNLKIRKIQLQKQRSKSPLQICKNMCFNSVNMYSDQQIILETQNCNEGDHCQSNKKQNQQDGKSQNNKPQRYNEIQLLSQDKPLQNKKESSSFELDKINQLKNFQSKQNKIKQRFSIQTFHQQQKNEEAMPVLLINQLKSDKSFQSNNLSQRIKINKNKNQEIKKTQDNSSIQDLDPQDMDINISSERDYKNQVESNFPREEDQIKTSECSGNKYPQHVISQQISRKSINSRVSNQKSQKNKKSDKQYNYEQEKQLQNIKNRQSDISTLT